MAASSRATLGLAADEEAQGIVAGRLPQGVLEVGRLPEVEEVPVVGQAAGGRRHQSVALSC
jgi:hypothetical protein